MTMLYDVTMKIMDDKVCTVYKTALLTDIRGSVLSVWFGRKKSFWNANNVLFFCSPHIKILLLSCKPSFGPCLLMGCSYILNVPEPLVHHSFGAYADLSLDRPIKRVNEPPDETEFRVSYAAELDHKTRIGRTPSGTTNRCNIRYRSGRKRMETERKKISHVFGSRWKSKTRFVGRNQDGKSYWRVILFFFMFIYVFRHGHRTV